MKFKFDEVLKAIGNTSICEKYIELEAEPVSEVPEWEKKFDDEHKDTACVYDFRLFVQYLKDFIRTEIIEKLIDDLNPRVGKDNHQHCFNKKAQAFRDKWLRGSK